MKARPPTNSTSLVPRRNARPPPRASSKWPTLETCPDLPSICKDRAVFFFVGAAHAEDAREAIRWRRSSSRASLAHGFTGAARRPGRSCPSARSSCRG